MTCFSRRRRRRRSLSSAVIVLADALSLSLSLCSRERAFCYGVAVEGVWTPEGCLWDICVYIQGAAN